jgi:hypothetical protein
LCDPTPAPVCTTVCPPPTINSTQIKCWNVCSPVTPICPSDCYTALWPTISEVFQECNPFGQTQVCNVNCFNTNLPTCDVACPANNTSPCNVTCQTPYCTNVCPIGATSPCNITCLDSILPNCTNACPILPTCPQVTTPPVQMTVCNGTVCSANCTLPNGTLAANCTQCCVENPIVFKNCVQECQTIPELPDCFDVCYPYQPVCAQICPPVPVTNSTCTPCTTPDTSQSNQVCWDNVTTSCVECFFNCSLSLISSSNNANTTCTLDSCISGCISQCSLC